MLDAMRLTPKEKIQKAKIQMYKRSPFFAYILLQMQMKKVEGEEKKQIPTMGVSLKGELYYNEDFVEQLPEDELLGVVAHETLHLALLHLIRTGNREPRLMNLAQDLVINDMLKRDNFSLPKEGAIPDYQHKWEYKGHKIFDINKKSAEEVYDELYAMSDTIIRGIESGEIGSFDSHIKGDKEDKGADGVKQSDKWKKVVAEAAQLAKQRGMMPAGMEGLIGDLLDSKVNWRTLLYRYIVNQLIYDYTWNTPSRRSASIGIYMPNTLKEGLDIFVTMDTSGSMGKKERQEAISELKGIVQSFPNVKMKLIIVDAAIHEVYDMNSVREEELRELVMSGGGGTDHTVVYDYVKENCPEARVLINLTDGYTSFPENPEQYTFDSLWVINKNGCKAKDVPFGEVIKIE